MAKTNKAETWKTVKLDPAPADYKLQVSDKGNLRTYHRFSEGNILKGSVINGYRVLRLKLFEPRSEKTTRQMDRSRKKINSLTQNLQGLRQEKGNKMLVRQAEKELADEKVSLKQMMAEDVKGRTINYHVLYHRLVANYFLPKPKKGQTIVAHLDFDKENNHAFNLAWMTPEENSQHQQQSPNVIREKTRRKTVRRALPSTKLTVAKVQQIKKQLQQGKTYKSLAAKYNITETQVSRIKRGENWGDVTI